MLANDQDPDGDPLTITQVSAALKGTAQLAAGNQVTYTPSAATLASCGAVLSDSFTYSLSDGRGGSATGLVSLSITTGACPPPPSSSANCSNGKVVAVVRTPDVPELAPALGDLFLLRAVLPLPQNTYKADHSSGFRYAFVVAQNSYPAEAEVIRLQADGVHAASLEISAMVPRIAASQSRMSYGVMQSCQPQVSSSPATTQWAQQVLATAMPQSFGLTARDVFDNRYFASPLSAKGLANSRVVAENKWRRTTRTFVPMQPLDPTATGVLPHLFGVFFYITEYAGSDTIGLDLRIANGGTVHSGPDYRPIGRIFFDELQLVLPADTQAHVAFRKEVMDIENTSLNRLRGTTGPNPVASAGPQVRRYRLIQPDPSEALHVFSVGFHTLMRLMVTPSGATATQVDALSAEAFARLRNSGMGFVTEGSNSSTGEFYYSPSNELTPMFNYGLPAAMPAWSASSVDSFMRDSHVIPQQSCLASGQAGANFSCSLPAAGIIHPNGAQYGGMTGGTGIDQDLELASLAVAGASTEALNAIEVWIERQTDRQRNHYFDERGDPIRAANFAKDPNIFIWPYRADWCEADFPETPLPSPTASPTAEPSGNDAYSICNALRGSFYNLGGHQKEVIDRKKMPPYFYEHRKWHPHDFQHLSRIVGALTSMTALKHDPAVIDLIHEVAAHSMMDYSFHWTGGKALSNYNSALGTGAGKGLLWGRGEGWQHQAIAFSHALERSSTQRAWNLAHLKKMVEMLASAQTTCPATAGQEEFGTLSRSSTDKAYTDRGTHSGVDQYFRSGFAANPKRYNMSQSWENHMVSMAVLAAYEHALRGKDTVNADRALGFLRKQAQYFMTPFAYYRNASGVAVGPRKFLPVLDPFLVDVYCGTSHPDFSNHPAPSCTDHPEAGDHLNYWGTMIDSNYQWNLMALGSQLSANPVPFICNAIDERKLQNPPPNTPETQGLRNFLESYGNLPYSGSKNTHKSYLHWVMKHRYNWTKPAGCP